MLIFRLLQSCMALAVVASATNVAACAAPQDDKHSEINCRKLRQLISAGHKKEALALLDGFLKDSPKDLNYLRGRVFLTWRMHDLPEALASIEKCIQLVPDDYMAYYYKSRILVDSGQITQARVALNKALELQPHMASLYASKSHLDYLEGKFQAGVKNGDLSIKYDPKCLEGYINRGLCRIELDQGEEALADMLQAQRLGGDAGRAHHHVALALMSLGRFEQALPELNLEIKESPSALMAYINRANVYCYLNRYKEALDDIEHAIRAGAGKVPQLYTNRASVYVGLGRYKEAIADCERAASLYRKCNHCYMIIGYCYYKLKDFKKGIEFCNKSINLNAHCFEAFYTRALCYAELGETEKCMSDLERANTIKQRAGTYSLHAKMAAKQGYFEQAMDDLNAMAPRAAGISVNAHGSDYNKLLAFYARMLKFNPGNSETYFGRGLTLMASGNAASAAADFETYLKAVSYKGTNAAEASSWLIICYRKLGQEAKAGVLRQAIEQSKSSIDSAPELLYLFGKKSAGYFQGVKKSPQDRTYVNTVIGLNFVYTGKVNEGLQFLKWVEAHGDKHLDEYALAVTELARQTSLGKGKRGS